MNIKKHIVRIFFVLLFISCKNQNPEEMLPYLNGYWEIEKVEMTNGEVKEFGFSNWIDFIEIEENKGIRKKVAPRLDGTFSVTEDEEQIEAKIENDSLHLYYTTPFDQWKETVLQADKTRLVILNKGGKKYSYKRFEKINLD